MDGPESNAIDLLAHWWLPVERESEQPGRRVPGRFVWEPDEGGDLQLMGELREPKILENHLESGGVQRYRARPSELERRYPVIHGSRTTQGGHEEAYTLLHSLSLNAVGFHGLDELPEHITVGAVLRGAWYSDPSEIEADRAIFDLQHLATWVDQDSIKTEFLPLNDGPNGAHLTIEAHTRPAISTTYDGAEVKLVQRLPHTGSDHSSGVAQEWQLVIEIKPMGELDRYTDIATDMRALVTIAAGKTSDITAAVLQHPKLHKYRLDGTPAPGFRDDITYWNRWAHRGKDSSIVRSHDLYFNFEQFGGADGIRCWLETASTYRTELRRVMATRYTDCMYLEDRIMNTCAALERFDKVRRPGETKLSSKNEQVKLSFVDHVQACVGYVGKPFEDLIGEPTSDWAKRVRVARNQLAHHDDPFRTTGQVGEYLLAEQVFWLFAMCMFRASGAPESTFEAVMEHQQIRWLQSEAAKRRAEETPHEETADE
ncbi:hypothetical protein EFK50_07085 [Nocardioides marmoriginsengisoli]|uniref:ApeA N-terminal domain-containing protein n=1 Tax=Nocardioides marmoriginsengisoli TaxID=661483 RepID=A0A3N0CLD2_9ACTN|nr:hypothetical protein [Nocardioides marmoriginsengisoli]RNL64285.1 hypothetical protein EFK50_07085 [Nocardioides marmoriginsengisoli]